MLDKLDKLCPNNFVHVCRFPLVSKFFGSGTLDVNLKDSGLGAADASWLLSVDIFVKTHNGGLFFSYELLTGFTLLTSPPLEFTLCRFSTTRRIPLLKQCVIKLVVR